MWREIFHFVIPLCWSTLSTMLIISLAALFTASGPILLLTGGSGNTFTLSYWIFYQVKFLGKYNQPAALGLIFTLIDEYVKGSAQPRCIHIYYKLIDGGMTDKIKNEHKTVVP